MPDETQIHYSDDDLVNPETHHETSDVNVRALIWFVVLFVILSVITHFLLHAFYRGLQNREEKRISAPLTQVQRPADADVPQNQPLLQPFPRRIEQGAETMPPYRNTPRTDLSEMRRAERHALENYGWVDQQKGVVRIPIEVAKRLVIERGLPVQTAPPPVPATTTMTVRGRR